MMRNPGHGDRISSVVKSGGGSVRNNISPRSRSRKTGGRSHLKP
jgi:hypothetical protein